MLTLESELRELVNRFNEAQLDYALCGGMAVALHGYPRFTKDIDRIDIKQLGFADDE